MKKINFKQPFWIWQTVFIGLALIALILRVSFGVNSILVTLVFFIILAWPGQILTQLLKVDFKGFFDNLVLWLAAGFVLAMLAIAVGIVLGLNIDALLTLYLVVLGILILSGMIGEIISPREAKISLSIKEIFSGENLIFWLLGLVILGLLIIVSINGTLFRGGDPSYHLSILRKVVEGAPLTPQNLGFTKSSEIHIAYGLPIWHTFLGLFTKLLNTDMFILYGRISVALSLLMILVWTRLIKVIIPTKFIAGLSTIFLIIFSFLSIFTVLPLPDALSQYILLPLGLYLALKFVFGQKTDWKLLGILTLFLIFMAAIHLTQYFYFLIITGFFLIFWLATQWKNKDWRPVNFRLLLAIFSVLVICLPFALILEIKAKMFSEVLRANLAETASQSVRYGSFRKFQLLIKLSYLAVPLALLFTRKNPKIWFILSLFAILPVVYFDPVKAFLGKILGYIFLNRIYGNVSWHFVIFGLIIGFLILIKARFLGYIKGWLNTAIIFLTLAVAVFIFWLEIRFQAPSSVYSQLFTTSLGLWLTAHLWLILIILGIAIGLIFFFQKNDKFGQFFALEEPKQPVFALLMAIILLFFFFSPKAYVVKDAFNPVKRAEKVFNPQGIVEMAGGAQTIGYIKDNIPAKSVFATNGRDVYLSMLLDQFLAAYPHSAGETKSKQLFDTKTPIADKLKFIKSSKLEYLLVINAKTTTYFDSYPQYFTNIFSHPSEGNVRGALIYRVNQERVKADIESK